MTTSPRPTTTATPTTTPGGLCFLPLLCLCIEYCMMLHAVRFVGGNVTDVSPLRGAAVTTSPRPTTTAAPTTTPGGLCSMLLFWLYVLV